MGFRARKSFTIMPGVRMTVTPRGVSASVGVRGARVTAHSSGRVTRTVGIPGTGISDVKTVRLGKSASAKRAPARTAPAKGRSAASSALAPTAQVPPRPGMFAPKWEKALHRAAVRDRDPDAIHAVAVAFPEARVVAAVLEALMGDVPRGDGAGLRSHLGWAWSQGIEPATDPFFTRYLPTMEFTLEVAPGVSATLALSRDSLGLLLAEAYQQVGDLPAAVAVVEEVTPSTLAAVSLAELYGAQERWADVIDLTNGLANDDEAAMFLLIQRADALRATGAPGAAREALKEALRLRSRPAGLRHRAYVERAYTYLAEGKAGMARRDLERVLAEDAAYPGLSEALAGLPQ